MAIQDRKYGTYYDIQVSLDKDGKNLAAAYDDIGGKKLSVYQFSSVDQSSTNTCDRIYEKHFDHNDTASPTLLLGNTDQVSLQISADSSDVYVVALLKCPDDSGLDLVRYHTNDNSEQSINVPCTDDLMERVQFSIDRTSSKIAIFDPTHNGSADQSEWTAFKRRHELSMKGLIEAGVMTKSDMENEINEWEEGNITRTGCIRFYTSWTDDAPIMFPGKSIKDNYNRIDLSADGTSLVTNYIMFRPSDQPHEEQMVVYDTEVSTQ